MVRKKDNKKVYALKSVDKSKTFTEKKKLKSLISERNILLNDSPFLVHLHYTFQNEIEYFFVLDFLSTKKTKIPYCLLLLIFFTQKKKKGGGDLSIHLRRLGHFVEKEVKFIAAELILALTYLHSRGVIYRDLKPENILLDIEGEVHNHILKMLSCCV